MARYIPEMHILEVNKGTHVLQLVREVFMDEKIIQKMGDELFGYIDNNAKRGNAVILDLSNVTYLSATTLGKLMTTNKKAITWAEEKSLGV